jgi:aminoglycoside/choline kinase family phosphotransferase
MNDIILQQLCKENLGETPLKSEKLPQSGSDRQYFRLYLHEKTVLGVYNPNESENQAFISLSNAFRKQGLSVPEVYGSDKTGQYYLCSDHGNTTLFSLLQKTGYDEEDSAIFDFFAMAVKQLVGFQLSYQSEPKLFEFCNEPRQFHQRSVMWDLNYFKYNFLKLNGIVFDENALEDEFERIATRVGNIELQGFMYRDFQSRNIMVDQQGLVFIDFQGGRRGPLQYDVVSLLWQARANLSAENRKALIDIYLQELEKRLQGKARAFLHDFDIVLLLRLLQVLGAYGFRGLYERKVHFIKSIPMAIRQLSEHFSAADFGGHYPELNKCIQQLATFRQNSQTPIPGLTINICSFSFLNGSYPVDLTGHGGGHVFDCRGLPNPGRLDGYKHLTGKDKKVTDYLKLYDEVETFLESVYNIIERHANYYENKGFTTLNISFGCTGGQHRSVYCAEEINKRLMFNGFNTKLWHREFPTI